MVAGAPNQHFHTRVAHCIGFAGYIADIDIMQTVSPG